MKINIPPELKRYYFAIGGIGILIIGIVLVSIFGSTNLRHDYKLENKINDIQQQMDTYTNSKKKLPDILPDIGVQESGGVEYKKIAEDRYMLCANFKTKSDGYSPPDYNYLQGVKSESLQSGVALDVNTHFTNGNSEGLKHEKGYSCIVYQPYQLSKEALYPYLLCNSDHFKLQPIFTQTIQSVNAAARQFSIGTETGLVYNNTTRQYEKAPAKVYTLSKDAKVFDSACKETSLDTVKAGDYVQIYQNESGLTADGLQVTYSTNAPTPPVKPGVNINYNLQ